MDSNSDVVRETLGQWGKWQRRSVLLIFLCKIPSCWCMAIIIFTAPSPRQVPFLCDSSASVADSTTFATSKHTNSHQLKLVYHPTLIEPNDKQFDIKYCDASIDLVDHAVRYNQTIDSSLWASDVNQMNVNVSLPCDSLRHRPFYYAKETVFDVLCSRNLVAAFTQFFHLFGVVSGGLIAMALMALYGCDFKYQFFFSLLII